MNYTVSATDGETVRVDAPNWMIALGKAMAFFDYDPRNFGRWSCEHGPGGDVVVKDTEKDHSWVVRPDQEIKIVIKPSNMSEPEEPEARRVDDNDDSGVDFGRKVAPLVLPTSAFGRVTPIAETSTAGGEDLAERLFDLSFDMMGVGPNAACALALGVLGDYVKADSCAAFYATINASAMHVGAASGTQEDAFDDQQVAFGDGLAGTCFDMGAPVELRNPDEDSRAIFGFDVDLSFEPRRVFCVPVQNEKGIFGVLQIVNPREDEGFDPEVVSSVARTLAGALAGM